LKVKVSQQFAFGAAGCAGSIIIPSTSRGVESKVSQQFTFVGSAGLAVPSLSHYSEGVESKSIPTVHFSGAGSGSIIIQVQVELLKVKYPNSLLFTAGCAVPIIQVG
jgi:hypothetical protein